jgi:hypothetical protein
MPVPMPTPHATAGAPWPVPMPVIANACSLNRAPFSQSNPASNLRMNCACVPSSLSSRHRTHERRGEQTPSVAAFPLLSCLPIPVHFCALEAGQGNERGKDYLAFSAPYASSPALACVCPSSSAQFGPVGDGRTTDRQPFNLRTPRPPGPPACAISTSALRRCARSGHWKLP